MCVYVAVLACGLQVFVNLLARVLELNSGPQEEQQMLLTREPDGFLGPHFKVLDMEF